MASTHPIAYHYDVNGVEVIIERVHVGTAYARNGNVGNPTEYFRWNWKIVSGCRERHGNGSSRADAYERARAAVIGIPYVYDARNFARCRNVRSWVLVRDEMRVNYRKRVETK